MTYVSKYLHFIMTYVSKYLHFSMTIVVKYWHFSMTFVSKYLHFSMTYTGIRKYLHFTVVWHLWRNIPELPLTIYWKTCQDFFVKLLFLVCQINQMEKVFSKISNTNCKFEQRPEGSTTIKSCIEGKLFLFIGRKTTRCKNVRMLCLF